MKRPYTAKERRGLIMLATAMALLTLAGLLLKEWRTATPAPDYIPASEVAPSDTTLKQSSGISGSKEKLKKTKTGAKRSRPCNPLPPPRDPLSEPIGF